MQELRLVLIVVGVLAIAALLIHGLWTSRKEQPAKFGEKPLKKMSDVDDQGFDQDGIGEVRVVTRNQEKRQEPEFSFGESLSHDPLLEQPQETPPAQQDVQPASEPVLSFSATEAAVEAPSSKPPTDNAEAVVERSAEPVTVDSSPYIEEEKSQPIEVEPEIEEAPQVEPALAESEPVVSEAEPEQEPEVLVLHVHANQGEIFKGTRLINSMEQYGLTFGDMNIYHRHVDETASSKVIFSVANIVKPGVFHQNVEFETPGISFFMTLPCYGKADQNFKLMLQTAQQIADDLGGLVMDDQRHMITPQKLDSYREKIKRYQSA
nr:cell division protein ZipA [Thaumasiovibrio subtropicus]